MKIKRKTGVKHNYFDEFKSYVKQHRSIFKHNNFVHKNMDSSLRETTTDPLKNTLNPSSHGGRNTTFLKDHKSLIKSLSPEDRGIDSKNLDQRITPQYLNCSIEGKPRDLPKLLGKCEVLIYREI